MASESSNGQPAEFSGVVFSGVATRGLSTKSTSHSGAVNVYGGSSRRGDNECSQVLLSIVMSTVKYCYEYC